MIEDDTTWYLGTVAAADGYGAASYKLAKYTNTTDSILTSNVTTAKVGLLRLGELMAGQFERYTVKGETTETGLTTAYWTLTPSSGYVIWYVGPVSNLAYFAYNYDGATVRPSMNLKSNVQIVSGTGTKSDPFVLTLGS